MPHSGYFDGTNLGEGWTGYETLVQVCVKASLTNRQAEVTLLLCRGCSYGQIQKALDVPWKEVWRSIHAANAHLEKAFPRLRELIELLQSGDLSTSPLWRDHPTLADIAYDCFCASEGQALYEAYRGPRRGDGKGPTLAVDPDSRRVFMPSILGWCDRWTSAASACMGMI